jgi:hypothetical protein
VQLNIVGCGIFPNETTIICSTPQTGTGEPETIPGKTVTTAIVLGCDTNGDGIPDLFIDLTNVTPVNANLVQGTIGSLAPSISGTAFPFTCCGGFASLTVTTTFSAGDNNIFNLLVTGGFTESFTCTIDLGTRAPVVISATPSQLDCSVGNDISIPGSCFILPNGTINVTSVFAVDQATGAIIEATNFQIITPQEIDAFFNFGSANAGHTFLIFVSGPNGTSRNLSAPSGTCPAGNEAGVVVTVTCEGGSTTPPTSDAAVITGCSGFSRNSAGTWVVTVTGTNFKAGAAVIIDGQAPKSVKFVPGTQVGNTFTQLLVKGKSVKDLKSGSGTIQVINPGTAASNSFVCDTK